jgi:uncharacterized protein (TIGR02996 family)
MPTLEAVRATEAAFVEDVCRHPGDDAPRLILADWLDEHGEGERAELIRVQCELARTVRAPAGLSDGFAATRWREHREDLRRRERELLQARWWARLTGAAPPGVRYWQSSVAHGWALPMPTGDGGGGLIGAEVEFRRGFVEEVTLPAEAFLTHAAALFRAAPVRRVTLSDMDAVRQRDGRYYLICTHLDRVPFAALVKLMDEADRSSREALLAGLRAACLLYGRRAAWPCPECGGQGVLHLPRKPYPSRPCPACAGRGHTVEEG